MLAWDEIKKIFDKHLVLLHLGEMRDLLRKVVTYIPLEDLGKKKVYYLLVVEEDVKKMTSDRMDGHGLDPGNIRYVGNNHPKSDDKNHPILDDNR